MCPPTPFHSPSSPLRPDPARYDGLLAAKVAEVRRRFADVVPAPALAALQVFPSAPSRPNPPPLGPPPLTGRQVQTGNTPPPPTGETIRSTTQPANQLWGFQTFGHRLGWDGGLHGYAGSCCWQGGWLHYRLRARFAIVELVDSPLEKEAEPADHTNALQGSGMGCATWLWSFAGHLDCDFLFPLFSFS